MDIINLNWIILFLIAIYILQGLHKGFLISVANTVGMAVSWLVGFLFSPLMSQAIAKGSFYNFLFYFTNGVDQLQASGNLAVTSLSQTQIGDIVSTAGLPFPFDQLVSSNMTNQVFEAQGFHTVSEYFGYTITNVVVNIFSFLVIYLIARIVISLLVNAVNYASPLPVLRKCDSLAGGAVGVLRGFLGMFALFMIIPVILISMPADFITPILNDSPMATFFYESNFLLGGISGVI
ncbi:CvpA family protein [Christensenella intestinihominis]|uniref:CvpA family protein n=1 Tax=Christensenella intestinihominis TaxID=1851429 RepID=UPI0008312B44|nr:CvpA family protein [Christensenella intestinihominis]